MGEASHFLPAIKNGIWYTMKRVVPNRTLADEKVRLNNTVTLKGG